MAEFSLLANLTNVIGAGLQLSAVLYDFATNIGTAGRDIRLLGTDVTLFCAILKEVRFIFSHFQKRRVSLAAIQST